MVESNKKLQIAFYENGKLRPTLLDQDAKDWAKCLVHKEEKTDKKGKPIINYTGVSRHQIRRLYDEVKKYQRSLSVKKGPNNHDDQLGWDEIKPLIKMVKSKTAYLVARMKDKERNSIVKACYDALYDLMDQSITLVEEQKDYNAFCLFFEAVYGFYYNLGGANTK